MIGFKDLKPGMLLRNMMADHSYAIVDSIHEPGVAFFLTLIWSPEGFIVDNRYPFLKSKFETKLHGPAEDRHKHVLIRQLFRYGIDRINK